MSEVRASVELKSSDAKLRELKRMRAIATLLLAFMTLVFVVTTMTRVNWPWVPYVRAFSEAAMVGACADWFAIVALFRRPFGLPIPHTAIVPSDKERIGAALGRFITNNFITEAALHEKLAAIDVLGADAGSANRRTRSGSATMLLLSYRGSGGFYPLRKSKSP